MTLAVGAGVGFSGAMHTGDVQQGPSLEALKRGDPEAQERLWTLHWDRVYATCARILGYGADASDVATDIVHDFLFTYVQNIEHERAIVSYLRLMATRRSLRRRRGADRHRELVPESVVDEDARGADVAAHTQLLLPRLSDCLEELTPKAQQVLKLRFAGELTTERIGQLVGGSKQYIGKLIRQSTEKLRVCLESKAS